MLIDTDAVARTHALLALRKLQRRDVQKSFHVGHQGGQHRFQGQAQQAKGFHAGAAHILQAGVLPFLLGQFPGLVGVHVLVHAVGQGHGVAQGFGVVAVLVQRFNGGQTGVQLREQGFTIGADSAQLAAKALGNEARCARRDVDVLAHQVRVDPRHEVVGVEVDVLVAAVELGGQVIAQPLGVHAQFQVLQGVQTGASALAHFFAVVHGQEAVHKNLVGHFAAAELQDGGPKQSVEGDDVFANEMVLLHIRRGDVVVIAFTTLGQEVLQ